MHRAHFAKTPVRKKKRLLVPGRKASPVTKSDPSWTARPDVDHLHRKRVVKEIEIADQDRAIAVADFVRRGQTVQLLVRDAASAGEDLRQLVASHGGGTPAPDERDTVGILLFSCNGRGQRMFGAPDHDARCVRTSLDAEVPTAGFFAAGEIGPVGGRNFLHGYTASVAIFSEPEGRDQIH